MREGRLVRYRERNGSDIGLIQGVVFWVGRYLGIPGPNSSCLPVSLAAHQEQGAGGPGVPGSQEVQTCSLNGGTPGFSVLPLRPGWLEAGVS